MEALDLSHVKAEKGVLSVIGKTLRILQFCLALFFLSWILTRLPFAFRLSANYLRSPLFVFAISNAIIAALFAQSRRHHKDIGDTCTATHYESEKDEDMSTTETENLYPEDKLSNEEFQRTIEAFIAKQMRFLREESLPIFVQTSPPTTPSSVSLPTTNNQ